MTITLMATGSPANMVTKTTLTVDTLNGALRYPTSLTDPTITIERSSPTGFNYFYIPEFGRYYFLTGVASVANNLISITGHVDVLMTYSSEIRALKAVVRRQENKYNLYLDDGIFKSYQNTKHKIITFPYNFNEYSYVLALAGNSE